ncbi:hypothetical protein BT67DRAFT_438964 [Trichocladium antarcticum]|uniref:Uncharacterized protein n=1 Tax=Trichocladium antarcticum TaxID=1450529 RepID=A0AAN6ZHI2_9PEZI|nr:hypothetical protein BT67DRAFT_438964 [Trichocladium antarcticum]
MFVPSVQALMSGSPQSRSQMAQDTLDTSIIQIWNINLVLILIMCPPIDGLCMYVQQPLRQRDRPWADGMFRC